MFPKLTSTTYFLEWSNHLIICYHLTNWLWSHNCPAVISLLNCLCWVEWKVLSTTLFLTNSSMVNSYYGLYTKGSSQYFNLAWAYLTGVTLISLVWRKWFMPENYLGNARASQLGSDVNETGIWLSPVVKFSM